MRDMLLACSNESGIFTMIVTVYARHVPWSFLKGSGYHFSCITGKLFFISSKNTKMY
jgi:hypothetical protein